ncbi:MAG TPA: hypothetical protein VGB14_17405 [Acidimicrobiales bacterium]|jgi:Flp pilus assembly pilin Flp
MEPRRCSGDAGGGLVEYALLLALIAAICLAAVAYFGRATAASIDSSCEQLAEVPCG